MKMTMKHWWNGIERDKRSNRIKVSPFSTTQLRCSDLESNQRLRGNRQATNCLSHNTAQQHLPYESKHNIQFVPHREQVCFFHGATAPSGPRPSHYQGFTITLSDTHRTQQDSSGRMIGPTQRPLPDKTQHSQETDIHVPGGILTHKPSKRVAVGLAFRPRAHQDRRTGLFPL